MCGNASRHGCTALLVPACLLCRLLSHQQMISQHPIKRVTDLSWSAHGQQSRIHTLESRAKQNGWSPHKEQCIPDLSTGPRTLASEKSPPKIIDFQRPNTPSFHYHQGINSVSLSKHCAAAFSMYHSQWHGKKYPKITINIKANQFQTLNLGLCGASWFLKT